MMINNDNYLIKIVIKNRKNYICVYSPIDNCTFYTLLIYNTTRSINQARMAEMGRWSCLQCVILEDFQEPKNYF